MTRHVIIIMVFKLNHRSFIERSYIRSSTDISVSTRAELKDRIDVFMMREILCDAHKESQIK